MAVVSGGFLSHSSTSGAELFSAGCFSEALNTYDTHRDEGYGRSTEGGKVPSQQSKTILNSKALYAACNRAAAKLELEMCRSCLRDCDEAICIDPFCLRAHVLKGNAFERLDKPAQARKAYEAGLSAGKEGGDVIIFVQLVESLRNLTTKVGGKECPTGPTSSLRRGDTTSWSSTRIAKIEFTDSTRSMETKPSPSQIPTKETIARGDGNKSTAEILSSELPACGVTVGDSPPGAGPSPRDGRLGYTAENLLDGLPASLSQEPGGEITRSAEEAGNDDGDGNCDGDGSTGTTGATGDGGSAPTGSKKKKKKKKSRNKRSKASKTMWAGEKDEFGRCLTLRVDNGGSGVVVEGFPEVLAASGISPVLLEAARGQLCHAVGDPDIDNLIALGYLQVNTGNYRKAIDLFRGLLSIRPGLVGAHLGLGSALALLGDMEKAVASFSAAIEANPLEPDCWKRRGQTRAAMGHAVGALSDLDRAVELFNGRDPDVLHQRGTVYQKLSYFNRAVLDFSEVARSNVDSKVDWNMIAVCRAQLGEPEASEKAYRRALAIDPSFKEAWTNLGCLLRDWGKGVEALVAFDKALALDAAYVSAYHLRGLCKHGMGDHRGAQGDFMRGLFYDAQDEHCRYMAALCMHARGQLDEAARSYDALLSLKPGHQAWYTRECCVYLWCNIRRPWREFSPDAELDPEFKEGWCKRHDPMTLKRYTRHRKPTGPDAHVTLSEVRAPSSETARDGVDATAAGKSARINSAESVLKAATPTGPGIQLQCPGFLTNARQHRMFGLASLELAQLVRGHWDSVKAGGAGAMVPNSGSSTWKSVSGGSKGAGATGAAEHPVGYRDIFDVAVRWRQLSEPNDPVWWIDRLTPEAFREGFGLQTPIVNGQLKVIRYYPYYSMALNLMKRFMCEQGTLEDEVKAAILHPDAGLAELHAAVGHDHWVVTPCERASLVPGTERHVMEGTRLTIVASPPEGFEFTIRTPGTPVRWRQYDEELGAVWGKLTASVCENADRDAGEEGEEGKQDAICDLILEMFFYWVNFGPLSRGSAACGYIVLSGLMGAAGWRLVEPLPANVQMDWEAILRPNPGEFMAKVRPWLKRSRRRNDILAGVPAVPEAFPTALEAMKALNGSNSPHIACIDSSKAPF